MKIILKEPLFIMGFNFPAEIELTVVNFGGVKLIKHPKNDNLLTSLPDNKEAYIVVPYFEIIKYFPIEGRQDFFKYAIVNEEGKISVDWKGEEMYFQEYQFEMAEKVLESINKVSKLNKEFISSTYK